MATPAKPLPSSPAQVPFGGENPWQVVNRVTVGERLDVPPPAALPGGPASTTFRGLGDYVGLMGRCWDQDPALRPTFNEIIACLRWAAEHAVCVWW